MGRSLSTPLLVMFLAVASSDCATAAEEKRRALVDSMRDVDATAEFAASESEVHAAAARALRAMHFEIVDDGAMLKTKPHTERIALSAWKGFENPELVAK